MFTQKAQKSGNFGNIKREILEGTPKEGSERKMSKDYEMNE
jgi:hypothetical protein